MELSLELGCQRESILGEQKHAKVKNGGINVSKVVDIVSHLCIRIFWIFVIFILHIGTTFRPKSCISQYWDKLFVPNHV